MTTTLLHAGHLEPADPAARRTVAAAAGHRDLAPVADLLRDWVLTARGNRAACLDRCETAERIELAGGLPIVGLHVASIRALLAMGEADHEAAIAHARRAERLGRDMGLGHPGIDPFAGDLIESLVRTGDRDGAAEVIAGLEEGSIRCDHAGGHALAARGRLLLGADDGIEELAAEALRWHDAAGLPFERARTLIVVGERRRRAGRRRDARVALLQAHADMNRMGARPWAERALAELRAAGGRVDADPAGGDALGALSPQEQQVARLIAEGATNREAATALFLSTKSIERHLTGIYRKLGLRSRTELARWFDRHSEGSMGAEH